MKNIPVARRWGYFLLFIILAFRFLLVPLPPLMTKKYVMNTILKLLFLLTIISFSSCKSNKERGKYHLGISQCSSGEWRDKQNSEMQRELLLHDDVSMDVACANDDVNKQIEDIQHFIDEKVDILIVSPLESKPLQPIISKAFESGIPVVLFDRHIKESSYTSFVGGDNQGAGKQLAAYVMKCLPNGGNVLEITGDMQTDPAQQRHKGLIESLHENASKIQLQTFDGKWKGDFVAEVTDSLLKVHSDIQMIVAHSDWMASAAKTVVDSIMPGNDIKFVGVDGFGVSNLGIYAVENGNIDATVIYPTGGDVIIKTAMEILQGKHVDKEIILASNLVSTTHEAMLINGMEKIANHEVETIMQMRERMLFYDNQLKLEKTMLLMSLALLTLAIVLVATFFHLYRVKQRSNDKLAQQQEDLRRQRDELLVVTRELEEATNSKLVFFTNISHDFRTPLSLISAPLENALGRVKDENVLNLLRIAQRNVFILLDLVNQILDFRKVENGKMELHYNIVNLRTYLEQWFESFQKLAEQRGINMTLSIGEGNWDVCCDIKKIERMVYNIVGNSMKFTPEGKTISLKCHRNAQSITIGVKDTGIGINKQNLERIFERFYQIENSKQEGTGIGLNLVKVLVELMHGTIEVASNDDVNKGQTGTTISLNLPIPDKTEGLVSSSNTSIANLLPIMPAPMEQMDIDEAEERPVVLVIDDNDDIRSYLYSLLGEQYKIITAIDGKQGVEAARKAIPDVILCDVMMPVMDGLECCRKLKDDALTCHIPIIMLTACSLDEQKVNGLANGAEAYISKPFSSAVLLAQVESTLKNRTIVRNLFALSTPPIEPDNTKHKDEEPVIQKAEESHELSKYDKQFLRTLHSTIEEKYPDENFNVVILSEIMCLSRAQLYRKCKALTGDSPIELIKKTRMVKAKNILETTTEQISDVAKAVGIPDASYFAKCYKAFYGSLPSSHK